MKIFFIVIYKTTLKKKDPFVVFTSLTRLTKRNEAGNPEAIKGIFICGIFREIMGYFGVLLPIEISKSLSILVTTKL